MGHNIRLWHTDLVEQVREILTKIRDATNLVSPEIHELPHLPTWAVHNWWDYWSRPYAYIDAPSGQCAHPTITVGDGGSSGELPSQTPVLVRPISIGRYKVG